MPDGAPCGYPVPLPDPSGYPLPAMPRPRTKGPHVAVRFPLAVHAVIEQRAAARGETVAEWVERKITAAVADAIVPGQPPRTTAPRTPSSRTSSPDVVPRFKPGR